MQPYMTDVLVLIMRARHRVWSAVAAWKQSLDSCCLLWKTFGRALSNEKYWFCRWFMLLYCDALYSRSVPLCSCFPSLLAVSCPASRAPAGMRSSPRSPPLIPTGKTSSRCAHGVSSWCATTWGVTFSDTCVTEMASCFACAACRSSTSSASRSAARPTCSTGCCCIRRSCSTRWRSLTGGPGNASVSAEQLEDCFPNV